MDQPSRLVRGDLSPRIVTPPPGPRSRALCIELDRHLAPGQSTVVGGEPALVWEEALGSNVLDVDGNLFVDLTAGFGVAAIGHRRAEILGAIAHQGARLIHALGDVAAHPARVELARRLALWAPIAKEKDEIQTFFAVSGAEAIEIALKTSLAATGKPGVIAFDPGYHGLTLGALAVSSRPLFRAPFVAHLHSHVERFPFGGPLGPLAKRLGRGDIGAVIFEPVVGREGVLFPPSGWLASLAELGRSAGALLIADEIFSGFGRTGHRFAVEAEGVRPDLLCCGKALGGGLPIAAVLANRQTFGAWITPGEALHTATFAAHPLACAAALATLDILEQENLPDRAFAHGETLLPRLSKWPSRFAPVAAARGRGLLWGIELRSALEAKRLVAGALGRGVLLLAGGPRGNVAQIAPPLTITSKQLERSLDLIESVLGAMHKDSNA